MTMRRRPLLAAGMACLATPHIALAQSPVKVYRVGWLSVGAPPATNRQTDAFKQELARLGYVEGRNVVFDFRFAAGRTERLPGLVAELIALQPDVIVALTTPAALVAKQATTTIPIVITFVSDPVGAGIVPSLARPAGNITGVTDYGIELAAKSVEVLRTLIPTATAVAVLRSDNQSHPFQLKQIQEAAGRFGLRVVPTMARALEDLDQAFASLPAENVQALIVLGGAPHASQRERIAGLAVNAALPTIFLTRLYVDAGGLLSYGANISHSHILPAAYVDKILRGAKPGDLPIEQPSKFEMVINMKTAKLLRLTIPQSLLLRADEVIQ